MIGKHHTQEAEGWLLGGLLEADRAGVPRDVAHAEQIRSLNNMHSGGIDEETARVLLAGTIAACTLVAKLRATDVDDDIVDAAHDAAHVVTGHDAPKAMSAHHALTALLDSAPERVRRALELLAVACRKTQRQEKAATLGTMMRELRDPDRQHLLAGWLDLFATGLLRQQAQQAEDAEEIIKLIAPRVARPVGMQEKARVATAAGISRPTLDAWIDKLPPAQ